MTFTQTGTRIAACGRVTKGSTSGGQVVAATVEVTNGSGIKC
jgi:hypothetical protein